MTVILGGGIAGLSAAYYAVNNAKLSSVILLEASSRVGGWIRSKSSPSGALFEQGPRTVRISGLAGKNTLNLVEDLQLNDKLIHIGLDHPAARNRLIYMDGALHRLPASIKGIFKTLSLLDRPLITRIWTDLRAPKVSKEDESIHSFVQRRLGQDIADNIVSPLICGICAGDAREISVNFLLKSLFEAEQKHGSIVKGLLANQLKKMFSKPEDKKNSDDEFAVRSSVLTKRAQKEYWTGWQLQGGLEQLPRVLADSLKRQGVKLQTEKKCEKITFKSDRVELLVNGDLQECSRVISGLCSKDLAELLREQHPELSAELKAIPTVTVAAVNLEFQGDVLPQAFGYLIPPKENLPVLGVLFDSRVFPHGSSTVCISQKNNFVICSGCSTFS